MGCMLMSNRAGDVRCVTSVLPASAVVAGTDLLARDATREAERELREERRLGRRQPVPEGGGAMLGMRFWKQMAM